MGDRPSVEAFQLFFSADTDGDGDVDPKEFAAIHSQLAKLAAEKAAAKYPRQFALFNALDADGSGSLDPAELAAQLSKQGSVAGGATPIMDVGTAGELVDALDRNADGKVDFLEFCHAWGRFDADK
jgi:Ca2+-binding EF-hand superfamily protein